MKGRRVPPMVHAISVSMPDVDKRTAQAREDYRKLKALLSMASYVYQQAKLAEVPQEVTRDFYTMGWSIEDRMKDMEIIYGLSALEVSPDESVLKIALKVLK